MSEFESERHKLMFGVRRSIRYHSRRQGFFERLHIVTSFIALMFSSAATVALFGDDALGVAKWLAFIVTAAAAVDLVIGTAGKASTHAVLARRFIQLEMRLLDATSEEDLTAAQRERLAIESDEPPVMHVVDMICHNEMLREMGYDQSHYAGIRWWHRLTANFTDLFENSVKAPPVR